MKKYKLKKNNWTTLVLPVSLLSFVVLGMLGIFVPETVFLSCNEVRDTLLEFHTGAINPLNEDQHLQYHEKYAQCLADGFIYPTDENI